MTLQVFNVERVKEPKLFHGNAIIKSEKEEKRWWQDFPKKHLEFGDRVLQVLSKEQVETFLRDGWLHIPAKKMWSDSQLKTLVDNVTEVQGWKETPGKWMMYFEDDKLDKMKIEAEGSNRKPRRILRRVENFLQYTPEMNKLFTSGKLKGVVDDLLGEESIIYKEKINLKKPGAEAFFPHQDVAAGWWMYGQTMHLSVSICIDKQTKDNGNLKVVSGEHQKGMVSNDWEEIQKPVFSKYNWIDLCGEPGDTVIFNSYVPHCSEPNLSNKPRRAMYLTYAAKSEGDFRDKYYADKRVSYPPDCERLQGRHYEYKV